MSAPVRNTTAPGKFVLLYDGHCRFCEQGSRKLAALMRRGSVERVDFQQPGVLEQFPGLTWEMCMARLHLVSPEGRVFAGAEAVCRALTTRRAIGCLAWVYYLPGLRLLVDHVYALIAARRYRFMGRAMAAGACDGGTCALHLHASKTHVTDERVSTGKGQ